MCVACGGVCVCEIERDSGVVCVREREREVCA